MNDFHYSSDMTPSPSLEGTGKELSRIFEDLTNKSSRMDQLIEEIEQLHEKVENDITVPEHRDEKVKYVCGYCSNDCEDHWYSYAIEYPCKTMQIVNKYKEDK